MAGQPAADLTEFLKLSKPKRPRCALTDIHERLSEQDHAAFQAALATDQGVITNTAIAQWLESRGIEDVHPQRVLSHRKRNCSCAR
jgi:hypothetical protein